MPVITTLNFDMDGVMVNWKREAINMFKGGGHNMSLTRLNNNYEFRRWVENEFNATPHRFKDLPPFHTELPILRNLLKYLSTEYVVQILSATTGSTSVPLSVHDHIVASKLAWLEKHDLLQYFHRYHFVPVSSHKVQYCTENSLLIDDFKTNVVEYIEHGGDAVLHTSLESTIDELSVLLNDPFIDIRNFGYSHPSNQAS